jgi:hypothetical protein
VTVLRPPNGRIAPGSIKLVGDGGGRGNSGAANSNQLTEMNRLFIIEHTPGRVRQMFKCLGFRSLLGKKGGIQWNVITGICIRIGDHCHSVDLLLEWVLVQHFASILQFFMS